VPPAREDGPSTIAPARTDSAASEEAADAYSLALRVFDRAFLCKPREDTWTGPPMLFVLAPLIVHELEQSEHWKTNQIPLPQCGACRFAALDRRIEGISLVESEQPVVYVTGSTETIHGLPHDQAVYIWFYLSRLPPDREHAGNSFAGAAGFGESDEVQWRGVRVTMDAHGFPLVLEPLSSCHEAKVLFVSAGLEWAAMEEYGPPLPGRRFGIERSTAEAPSTLIARTFEDGPVPMGPYVYLTGSGRAISTLLCRCSPSQVLQFVGSDYYELRPMPSLARQEAFVDSADNRPLQDRLRWPREYKR
jgi:hypothetical protein